MTAIKSTIDPNERLAAPVTGPLEASSQARSSVESTHHNIDLDWDQMMSEYTVIERRAQAMRSEAAWNMARAFGNWIVRIVGQGKARAGAAAATSLPRQGQPT